MAKQTEELQEYVDVKFARELMIAGAMQKTVRMREPTVADQLAAMKAKGNEVEQEIVLVANLCMATPEEIKNLPMREYKKLQAALMVFIGSAEE